MQMGLVGQLRLLEHALQLLGQLDCLLGVGARQQHHETLVAPAREHVGGTQGFLDQGGDSAQHLFAFSGVAVRPLDRVDVDLQQHQRHGFGEIPAALELLLEDLAQIGLGQGPGQLVAGLRRFLRQGGQTLAEDFRQVAIELHRNARMPAPELANAVPAHLQHPYRFVGRDPRHALAFG